VGEMLSADIAEKIRHKVAGLTGQSLAVTNDQGEVLACDYDPSLNRLDIVEIPWSIGFQYNGKIAGYIVTEDELTAYDELEPLIRTISELVMHQAILLEQLPRSEERFDKFVYDLLAGTEEIVGNEQLLAAEARLFDIEIDKPRIAIIVQVDDPSLLANQRQPGGEREVKITRIKNGIRRALGSFYTSSRDNVVSYLGQHHFCILKDMGNQESLDQNLETFKKSINTIYNLVQAEVKCPVIIGIGNYHPGIAGLRQSYGEANSAIELGRQIWDQTKIYHIDDFGVVAPLLSGIDEQNIYFSRELLEKLGENGEIIQTIETFFDKDMSLTQTADSLGIHRNTLVYRLDRITDLLSLDPRKFDDAVQIKLAILFTKFVEGDYVH
jgi:carbohydrate diacid regulator